MWSKEQKTIKKILIAGLGIGRMKDGKYEETCYRLGEQSRKSCLLPAQLLKDIIKPDKIYFVGTNPSADSKSKGSSWGIPEQEFGVNNYKKIVVPYGESESDWWKTLQELTSISTYIEEGDEIYLDVTHGFRSLPIFFLMVLIYFEKIFGARICGVYYGMYEYSSEEEIKGEKVKVTPIVDLTPVIHLKDWIEHFTLFINYGDATPLSNLIQKEYKGRIPDTFTDNLNYISSAFGLNYVKDICKISKDLKKSKSEISNILNADNKPGALISSKLFESLNQFSQDVEVSPSKLQLKIAKWYMKHRRFTQCIILLAEIILTFLIEHINKDKVFNRNFRENVSKKLIGPIKAHGNFQQIKKLLDFAYKLNQLRNQTAHADMREERGMKLKNAPDTVKKKFNKVKSFIENKEISDYLKANKEQLLDFIEDNIVVIDVARLYENDETANVEHMNLYIEKLSKNFDYKGKIVKLTGRGPIWLYLKISHFLHGHAAKLQYTSPLVDNITVFDHTSR